MANDSPVSRAESPTLLTESETSSLKVQHMNPHAHEDVSKRLNAEDTKDMGTTEAISRESPRTEVEAEASSAKTNAKDTLAREFDFEWIQQNVSTYIQKQDFEDIDEGVTAKSFVKKFTKENLLNAVGIMTYIDNLEKQVSKLNGELKDLPRPAAKQPDVEARKQPSWITAVKKIRVVTHGDGDEVRIPYDKAWVPEEDAAEQGAGTGCHIVQHCYQMRHKGEVDSEYVKIMSPHLQQALKEVMTKGDESLLNQLNSPVGLEVLAPFWAFYQYREELKEHRETLEEPARSHLSILLQFLDSYRKESVKVCEQIAAGTIEEIKTNLLPLLYCPGTLVFNEAKGGWRAYEVAQVDYSDERIGFRMTGLTLKSKQLYSEGGLVDVRVSKRVATPAASSVKIVDLEFIPMALHPQRDQIQKTLVEQGKHYCSYAAGPMHKQYKGNAWSRRDNSEPLRVIVDIRRSLRSVDNKEQEVPGTFVGNCTCADCTRNRHLQARLDEKRSAQEASDGAATSGPDEVSLMLCPSHVPAFSLRIKSEQEVELKDLEKVKYERDAWNKLVMPREHKALLKSVVDAHIGEKVVFSDLVRGKGKGLIILLHGSPGTGKTLTAECVAEQQKRPLYTIACGDLGTEASELETTLRDTFEVAVRWGAILLLDEADVFLQERDIQKLKRNALVSVFLREVEYFDGILFLTTNRAGILDEAFRPRIHLTLPLPDLGPESRDEIWRLLLYGGRTDLEEHEEKVLRKIRKWTRDEHLNGRQIRNHVMTASALAVQNSGSKQPTFKEIKQILRISRNFSKYMTELHGDEQNTIAEQRGLRLAERPVNSFSFQRRQSEYLGSSSDNNQRNLKPPKRQSRYVSRDRDYGSGRDRDPGGYGTQNSSRGRDKGRGKGRSGHGTETSSDDSDMSS